METEMSNSEFEERGQLIESILNKIKPFPQTCDEETRELIDADRQILVLRAGWGSMPIRQLRELASK